MSASIVNADTVVQGSSVLAITIYAPWQNDPNAKHFGIGYDPLGYGGGAFTGGIKYNGPQPTAPNSYAPWENSVYETVSSSANYSDLISATSADKAGTPVMATGMTGSYTSTQQSASNTATILWNMIYISGVWAASFGDFDQHDINSAVDTITKDGYDSFVAANGPYYISGVVYGQTLTGYCSSIYTAVSSAIDIAGTVFANYNGENVSGSTLDTIASQATSVANYSTIVFGLTAAPPIDFGGSLEAMVTAINNFNSQFASSPTLTENIVPLFFICDDWRTIPQIGSAAATDSGQSQTNWDGYNMNLPVVQDVYFQLSYCSSSALNIINNGLALGATSQAAATSIQNSVGSAMGTIDLMSAAAVSTFDLGLYGTLSNDAAILNDVAAGQTNIEVSVELDSQFTLAPGYTNPQTFTNVMPTQDSENNSDGLYIVAAHAANQHGKMDPDWNFGFIYFGPLAGDPVTGRFKVQQGMTGKDWGQSYYNQSMWSSPNEGTLQSPPLSGVYPDWGRGSTQYPWLKTTITIV